MKLIKLLILSIFLLTFSISKSQGTVIFSENMGSPSGTTTISVNTFQNSGTLTYGGNGDVRSTTPSSGYIGSSGSGNVFLTNSSFPTGRWFIISGFTSTGFNSLNLSFGFNKSTTSSIGDSLKIEYSIIGSSGPWISLSKANVPSGSSAWYYQQIPTIPVGANAIKFTNTSANTQFRVDDVLLEGFNIPTSSGLVINEASQGELGDKEFIEMVVAGPPCTRVDLRGWIIDDNNGVFSSGPQTGVGIATGHIKFSNNIYWSAVSTGTIILIYNSTDISSSITTTSQYNQTTNPIIFPIPYSNSVIKDSTYFIGNGDYPIASPASALYSSTRTFPAWGQIQIANDNDGFQIRKPDTTFFHGFGYGSLQITHPDSSIYKPNHLLFRTLSPTTGNDRNYYINDSISYDFKDKRNWITTTGSGTRTPGLPNNAKNNAWINYLIGGCLLPIELSEFKSECVSSGTKVYFTTLSQSNVKYLSIEKSLDAINWKNMVLFNTVRNSNSPLNYDHIDTENYKYYRIKEVDLDGTIIYSNMIYSNCLNTDNKTDIKIINNNTLNIQTNSNEKLILSLYSIDGRLIKSGIITNSQIELETLSRGIYVASLISESGQINIVKKILVK